MCDEFWLSLVPILIYKHITRPHINTSFSLAFLLLCLLALRLIGPYLADLM